MRLASAEPTCEVRNRYTAEHLHSLDGVMNDGAYGQTEDARCSTEASAAESLFGSDSSIGVLRSLARSLERTRTSERANVSWRCRELDRRLDRGRVQSLR